MMMRGRVVVAATSLILGAGFSSLALAGSGSGEVDWNNRVVKVTGKGAPNLRAANITVARRGAEKAAKLEAMRNILETLKGVEVSSGESVGGIIESNSAVKAKVQGVQLRASAESPEMARRFLKWGRQALVSLEAEWGPYPYRRLEIVSVPLSGAVDGGHGPGLVLVSTVFEGQGDLFSQGALSGSPGGAGGADLQELTVVHQIAHQWIGEEVATPGPASPVIEEMIASYGLLRHAARRHGPASARALEDKVMGQLYRTWRSLGSDDAPADRPFATLTLGGWVGLGLGKASLLLPRLERSVGARSVRRAVRAWLSAGRFGVQNRASLQAALLAAVPVAKRPSVIASLRRGLDEVHGDETIGAGDLDAIFGAGSLSPGMMPGGGSFGALDDPAVQKLMQEMLRALQGGGP